MDKNELTIFRAYDIRGTYGVDITINTMVDIGMAFGTYLKTKDHDYITVGGDIRASTNVLQSAFIAGVTSTGISCDVIERSPLGITLFNSFHNKYAASAFITASHLPPEWNGIKFYWGEGIGFSPEENEEVKAIFMEEKFHLAGVFDLGKTYFVDPYQDFVEYLKSKFTFNRQMSIAIDCGNGATALVVPQLFEDLGFKVISIFSEPDPKFPNRPSEPTEESLRQLSDFVKSNNVDFGAGFDGDGDRCVFTDENGKVISSDAFGVIVAKYLLKIKERKNIVINMECSLIMEKYLKDLGAVVERIRVGHSFLSLEAKKLGAIFGVEASGHAIVPDIFLFDDALILPLIFAAALLDENKSVSELASSIVLPIKKRFDLKCPDKIKFGVLEKVMPILRTKNGDINDVDGVSLTNDNGRILIRVSNTSPKVRVTIESDTEQGFSNLQQEFLPIVQNLIDKNH